MQKKIAPHIFFLLVLVNSFLFGQNRRLDSLSKIFPTAHDTTKVQILCSMSRFFEANDPNKSLALADSALKIAKLSVSGAMLSVFANSSIKNIIITNNFKNDPAGILTELCSHKMHFADAKNGLIQLRNGSLIEHPANRWGISGNNGGDHLRFTNHVIETIKVDKFYLSTDGFIDQFGGPKGKKFKQKQLKDLVVNYSNLSFDVQADNLINDFIIWKGILEQIDDVTLIGFEI